MHLLLLSGSLPSIAETTTSVGAALAAFRAPAGLPLHIQAILFEKHWSWWIALLAAALVVRMIGRVQQSRLAVRVGWILVAMVIAWFALDMVVITPRERLLIAHSAVAKAAGNQDIATIVHYLGKDFQSPSLDVLKTANAEAEIRDRLNTYGIKKNTITHYASEILPGGTQAVTHITVRTESAVGPVVTHWKLEWEDEPDSDWRIHYAAMIGIGDQPVGEMQVIPKSPNEAIGR